MSTTSRRSTVTGTPSASGMSGKSNISVINYAYLLKSRISTAGGLFGFTSYRFCFKENGQVYVSVLGTSLSA